MQSRIDGGRKLVNGCFTVLQVVLTEIVKNIEKTEEVRRYGQKTE